MRNGIPGRFDRLPRKRPAGSVGDRQRRHHREPQTALVEQFLNCEERRLQIERVKGRFRKKDVHPAIGEAARLLVVRVDERVERYRSKGGVVDVGRERGGSIRRPDRTGSSRTRW